jgi:L-ascorbate metabolism protein UlaG (beta-lactamase superfamily)
MELQYYGANCIRITTKKSVVVTDPKSNIADIKPDLKKVSVVLATRPEFPGEQNEDVFIVDGPGEYEFEDVSIKGIAAQPHDGSTGDNSATMYRVTAGDTTMLITGHITSNLLEVQLEAIGMVDIIVVPVGGGGYTLDAIGAATVVRAIEPKVVIPVHSGDDKLKYEVPQADLELFTKELGAPIEEAVEKYKVKALPEATTVQLLRKS